MSSHREPALDDRTPLETAFAEQSLWCKSLGSPLYARIAMACSHLVRESGPIATLLEPFREDPRGSVIVLRYLGALHRLALTGEAPELARHYPSCGGDGDADAAARVVAAVTKRLHVRLATLMPAFPQTNEVSRAAAILGGFFAVAERTRLPLRILEIGASAGLNLRFDRFFYRCGSWSWGDPHSGVVLDDHFDLPPPLPACEVRVVERKGCDVRPIDATTHDGLTSLRSYVWPDQGKRLALLAAAAEIAKHAPATVEREGAATWLGRELAVRRPGIATVVYHTVVEQYLAPAERTAVNAVLERAAGAATVDAPFAHLSLEPRRDRSVMLSLFPGDEDDRVIAAATMHGRNVRWIDEGALP